MALKVYNLGVFAPAYEVGIVTGFTGDGTTITFPLAPKTSVTTGDTIQVDLDYFSRALGGFTFPDVNNVTLSEAPPLNSQGIIPGSSAVVAAGFDQVTVTGVTGSANVVDTPFWVAEDGSGLTTNIYDAEPGTPGIAILFSNMVTAAGAQTSWCQLACADASGNALTYQATGATLYTAKYGGFTAMASACNAGATTLLTTSASSTLFNAGDYIRINPGNPSQEDVQITAKSTNTLTITGTNFAHSEGEFIFMVGRKFWWRLTIPVDILGGEPGNFYNLPIGVFNSVESRL